MRDEHYQRQGEAADLPWAEADADASSPPSGRRCQVVLESVDARAGGSSTRRVFRGWLSNQGDATAAVTLDVSLAPPFLPSAPVLMQRLFTIEPGESVRVELGSTVGQTPSAEDVRGAVRLRVG